VQNRVPSDREYVALPRSFFVEVMPQVEDAGELKAILRVLYLLGSREASGGFVKYGEMLSRAASTQEMEEATLRRCLSLAVKHGAVLRSTVRAGGKWEEAYCANTESGRRVVERVGRGELPAAEEEREEEGRPGNIFVLYEQNIGMITPMIAEELKEAEKLYPRGWIGEAFKEAAVLNKRSWRYIARILERWATEGKDSGEHRQGTKAGGPDKYIRGKYGHRVKR
jgi:DNA replication protein